MNDSDLQTLHSRIYPVRRQLQEAFKGGHIPKELYHKALVCIAYEYAVAGYGDETMAVVLSVPPSYFKGPCTTHMEQDADFLTCATTVAKVLRNTGLAVTQKVANA